MKRLLFSVFTVLLLTVGTVWGDSFEDGLAAHKRGDNAEAVKWFQLSAAQGNVEAQTNLGSIYYYGQGVAQDYAEALKWYRLAAAQGHTFAQHNLGEMYRKGEGVAQDYAEAVKWYRLAAAQGNAGAQFQLGMMYALGSGVSQDYVRAYMWLSLGTALDNELAKVTRNAVEKEMSSQQIAKAQKMVRLNNLSAQCSSRITSFTIQLQDGT
jgi:hypothetical protein